MKITAFHSNELNVRGTNVALYDYAKYNEQILGNRSYIISNKNADLAALKKFTDRFEVMLYNDFRETFDFARSKNIEYVYYVKAGDPDGKDIPNTKALNHAVFQHKHVHGFSYAYISEWLADTMGLPGQYVPYMVDMPQPQIDYRDTLNIPKDAIIIGRHGGYNEFDLPFVHSAIYEALKTRNDIYFVFMNTRPFGPQHPNIKYVNSTYNTQSKSNFINTCDFMIHGRYMGESFGLAIGEFLFHDKPVISWRQGTDLNHTKMLKDKGYWYDDYDTLSDLLKNLQPSNKPYGYYKQLVDDFSPANVMKQFSKVFYKDI